MAEFTKHLYLSLLPEALIASQLSPEEFGVYYAIGGEKKSRGQAIFFELDPEFRTAELPVEEGLRRCTPHDDGSPKRSVYISVYRALERVSLDALLRMYLVTQDGRVLPVEAADACPEDTSGFHLYQEIAPVSPLVVSSLGPLDFFDLIVRNPTSLLKLPAVCFAELKLGQLGTNPEYGAVGDLPYSNIDHLRQCLVDLRGKTVHTKMVDRVSSPAFPYRMLKTGIFIGNTEQLLCFPMPSEEELRTNHYRWWRSADM
jgi:hypothetical protein